MEPSVPRSKRLLTDERSNVFVYMTGHGGNEFLKFQDNEEISAFDIADAFEQMYQKKRYVPDPQFSEPLVYHVVLATTRFSSWSILVKLTACFPSFTLPTSLLLALHKLVKIRTLWAHRYIIKCCSLFSMRMIVTLELPSLILSLTISSNIWRASIKQVKCPCRISSVSYLLFSDAWLTVLPP